MKGSKMSAILAMPLVPAGVLAIGSIAHSQQITRVDALSPDVSPYAISPITNSLHDVNYCCNFTFRLPKNAVLGAYATYTSTKYLGTPASQYTSFSVVRHGDLNGDGVVNFGVP